MRGLPGASKLRVMLNATIHTSRTALKPHAFVTPVVRELPQPKLAA